MIFYSGNECCFVELGWSCCLQLFCYITIDGDNNVIIIKGGNCEHFCSTHVEFGPKTWSFLGTEIKMGNKQKNSRNWATKLPWAEIDLGFDGKMDMVRCQFCI